jgi:hypothetical protein
MKGEIHTGQCYWVRIGDLPTRKVLVEWSEPATSACWHWCRDLDSGGEAVLIASDFVRPCYGPVALVELPKGLNWRRPSHLLKAGLIVDIQA